MSRRERTFFDAMERTGLNVLGVTNMPEFGLIDGTESALYGSTRNPWHLDYSPGRLERRVGSRGGGRDLADGTWDDGGGSIRMPASHCGLFGLKVSRTPFALRKQRGALVGVSGRWRPQPDRARYGAA